MSWAFFIDWVGGGKRLIRDPLAVRAIEHQMAAGSKNGEPVRPVRVAGWSPAILVSAGRPGFVGRFCHLISRNFPGVFGQEDLLGNLV